MNEEKPEDAWDQIGGSQAGEIPLWDEGCRHLFTLIEQLYTPKHGSIWLEAGSGTGRVSLRLAKEHCVQMILLDTSAKAIKVSQRIAKKSNVRNVVYVIGSIFNLPFRDEIVDVIWSAGVFEHFRFKEQQNALEEFLRCTKANGFAFVIVPHRKAIFYNFARRIASKIGTWLYGYEEPLSTKDFLSPPPDATFSTGFSLQFEVTYLPYISAVVKQLTQIARTLF